MEEMFSMRTVVQLRFDVGVEEGLNTSTVAFRVVGGDKEETSGWGYNWATLFLGDINRGPGPPRWGSLKSETVNYGQESRGTRT
jgi:hypothetical protein